MIITTPRTLAVYLRDYCKRQKLSQSEIANKVGLRQARYLILKKILTK